jgi:hypothetical protein
MGYRRTALLGQAATCTAYAVHDIRMRGLTCTYDGVNRVNGVNLSVVPLSFSLTSRSDSFLLLRFKSTVSNPSGRQ